MDRYPEGEREVKVELTVNGKDITADVEDRMLLVHFLRDVADLTATNIGCETTSCGACTVLLDGESVKSCTVLAAQALCEEVLYDADGNPLTSTLADYGAITAAELPSFELVTSETPTPLNPLGVKGIGEAGTIGATPAVQNAVIDALSHLGVRHVDMPTTPMRIWRAMQAAQKESA